MRKIIIHPTHRKLLRLLRERLNNGVPVVMLENEINDVLRSLPLFQSPTARNQYVYRVILRAMRRPLSEIQHCTGFFVFNSMHINLIESLYAKVERQHLCATLINMMELYRIRRHMSSNER